MIGKRKWQKPVIMRNHKSDHHVSMVGTVAELLDIESARKDVVDKFEETTIGELRARMDM